MTPAELKQLEEFAAANFTRYMAFYDDCDHDPEQDELTNAGIVWVESDDGLIWVVDPFLSECARFKVDPVECYGAEVWEAWKTKALAAIGSQS